MAEELGWSEAEQTTQTEEALDFLATFGGPVADKEGALLRVATSGHLTAILQLTS